MFRRALYLSATLFLFRAFVNKRRELIQQQGFQPSAAETLLLMYNDARDAVVDAVADGLKRANRVHEVEVQLRRARLMLEHQKRAAPGTEGQSDAAAAQAAGPAPLSGDRAADGTPIDASAPGRTASQSAGSASGAAPGHLDLPSSAGRLTTFELRRAYLHTPAFLGCSLKSESCHSPILVVKEGSGWCFWNRRHSIHRELDMRILTHNMLLCNVKRCNMQGYPLRIVATQLQTEESEFNVDFLVHMLPRLDWRGVLSAAANLNIQGLPETLPADAHTNMELLQNLHRLLMDIRVIEAQLVCPNCGRVYPIRDGIPNMLLNEDEI